MLREVKRKVQHLDQQLQTVQNTRGNRTAQ